MDENRIQRIKQRYGIVGRSEALDRALEIALKIAPVDLSVLITGENGVGKEIFPRIIHDASARRSKKYFAVNCGAIPEGTIDSELFGHEKGAFTGAIGERDGYFGAASGGTLFLDEVGELPLPTQARLLRVLETGEYIRVGSSEVRKTDVRIVAATNVDMARAVAEGRFREDLFYRLNSIPIAIPPLRERGEDIVLLFRKFALEMSEKYKMPPLRLTDEAGRRLVAYSWPGNVRQLKNLTENMSVTCEEREVTPAILDRYLPAPIPEPGRELVATRPDGPQGRSFENEREILYQILFDLRRDVTELKKYVHENVHPQQEIAAPHTGGNLAYYPASRPDIRFNTPDNVPIQEAEEIMPAESEPTARSLDDLERDVIRTALDRNHGRRKAAAAELGISERTLYRKIKEYDVE